MKKIVPAILYALFALPLFAQSPVTLDNAINDYASGLIPRIPQNTGIAVLAFETDRREAMVYFFDTMLEKIWEKGSGIRIYERQRLENLQQELDFSLTGRVSDETAQRIGHFVGVGTIIYGSLNKIGNGYRMTVRATDVETGRVLFPKSYDLQMDSRLAGLLGISETAWADEVRRRAEQSAPGRTGSQPPAEQARQTPPPAVPQQTPSPPVPQQQPAPSFSISAWLGEISRFAYRSNFIWAASLKWDSSEKLGFDISCFGINYSPLPFMSFGANMEIAEIVPFGVSGVWGIEFSAGFVFPIVEFARIIGNGFIGFPGFGQIVTPDFFIAGYIQKDWLHMNVGFDAGLLLDFGGFCIELKYQGEWYSQARYANSIAIGIGYAPDWMRPWWW